MKDAEIIGNINEIIGIAKDENEEGTKTGKTSIMTTSTGRTLKRKLDDDEFISEEKEKFEEVQIPKVPKTSSVA